ncbi:TPA: hypothetical protein ACGUWG_004447, partial [Vibrio vulnificus]
KVGLCGIHPLTRRYMLPSVEGIELMSLYEKRNSNSQQEDAMLVASDSWFTVKFAQEAAKSWKRIILLFVVAILCLFAPALGLIVSAINALFS